jgi:hypothetical protein
VIDVSVTPFAVAPFAVPWPHGDASVPNVAAVAAVVGASVLLPALVDDAPLLWFAPHALATTAITITAMAQRARELVGSLRSTMQPPGHVASINLSIALYISSGRCARCPKMIVS